MALINLEIELIHFFDYILYNKWFQGISMQGVHLSFR